MVVGAADDLQAARAIRRALADRGLKARSVDFVAIWTTEKRARPLAGLALLRGLGRFAKGVSTVVLDPDPPQRCASAIASGEAHVALALTIDPIAGSVAVAFDRPR
jgi:hypothetical protein